MEGPRADLKQHDQTRRNFTYARLFHRISWTIRCRVRLGQRHGSCHLFASPRRPPAGFFFSLSDDGTRYCWRSFLGAETARVFHQTSLSIGKPTPTESETGSGSLTQEAGIGTYLSPSKIKALNIDTASAMVPLVLHHLSKRLRLLAKPVRMLGIRIED